MKQIISIILMNILNMLILIILLMLTSCGVEKPLYIKNQKNIKKEKKY